MQKLVWRIEHGFGTDEDLDMIDNIATQACGQTICVMAEAFSWPAQSYLAKFHDDFKRHIKQAACPYGGLLSKSPLDDPSGNSKA